MSDSGEEPATQEKEGDDKESKLDTYNFNPKVDKLDEKTLKKIVDSCHVCEESRWDKLTAIPLSEVGYPPVDPDSLLLMYDQEKLKLAMARMIETGANTDVKVEVQGQVFDCHLVVLQVSTDFFKQFQLPKKIIILEPEVTKLGFKMAYEWMIKQDLAPQREGLIDLYVTAQFLIMPNLINQLQYCFEHADCLLEGEAFKLYLQAIPFQTFTLQNLLLNRLYRFFLSAVATVEFLSLNVSNVCEILLTNCISVNSEMEVFFSAFRWMMCDWQNRKDHIEMLMQTIRFNLMPAWYIVSLKSIKLPPELKELLETPEVQAMLDEGLSYTVTQHFMAANSPLEQPLNMEKTPQREWILDETAAHHHIYNCANWEYLDYELFNAHLENIIKSGAQYHRTLKPLIPSNFQPCCRAVIENNKALPEEPLFASLSRESPGGT